jgi:sugar phosphate isomerase/epimerase
MKDIICGVQLYTLRKYGKTPEAVGEVFRKVSETGAKTVQVSGLCSVPAETLKRYSEETGMSICCTHSPFKRIREDLPRLAEEHLTMGSKIIGIGMMPGEFRSDGYKRLPEFIDFLNETSLKLQEYSLTLAYHNHNFEFHRFGEEVIYDKMIKETRPEVGFIMDTYWVKFAGASIEEYLGKLKGRLPVIHLKDYKKCVLPLMKPLGKGILPFPEILDKAIEGGTKYAVFELDFSRNPYKAVEISMEYLKKTGYLR